MRYLFLPSIMSKHALQSECNVNEMVVKWGDVAVSMAQPLSQGWFIVVLQSPLTRSSGVIAQIQPVGSVECIPTVWDGNVPDTSLQTAFRRDFRGQHCGIRPHGCLYLPGEFCECSVGVRSYIGSHFTVAEIYLTLQTRRKRRWWQEKETRRDHVSHDYVRYLQRG